jgi:predicted Zn-dependent protease
MTNAPEKIWVHFSDFDEHDVCTSYPVENAGEYTRTDISQARIAELEARVEQVIKQRNHARKTIGSQKRRLESEIAVLEKVVTALKAKP